MIYITILIISYYIFTIFNIDSNFKINNDRLNIFYKEIQENIHLDGSL